MKSRKTGKTETLFGETRYAARKWSHRRRVIIKAEIVRYPGRDPRDNDRFVVTNLSHKPENVYKIYRGRGDAENRIKELHHGLEIDRTICTSFLANQLRVLRTAAADVLQPALRNNQHSGLITRPFSGALAENFGFAQAGWRRACEKR